MSGELDETDDKRGRQTFVNATVMVGMVKVEDEWVYEGAYGVTDEMREK